MLRIDRRLAAHIEWPLLILALLVVGVGLMTILSATHHSERLLSATSYDRRPLPASASC
jgi:hypothetical protein